MNKKANKDVVVSSATFLEATIVLFTPLHLLRLYFNI